MGAYKDQDKRLSTVALRPPQTAAYTEAVEAFSPPSTAPTAFCITAKAPRRATMAPDDSACTHLGLAKTCPLNLLHRVALPICLFSSDATLVWSNRRARALAQERRDLPDSTSDDLLFANLRQQLRESIITARFWPSDSFEVAYSDLPGQTISLFRVTDGIQLFVFALLLGKAPLHGDTLHSRWSAYGLTATERKIAEELLRGRTAAEIAQSGGIKLHTVRTHIKHIYSKLGVHCREKLLATMNAI